MTCPIQSPVNERTNVVKKWESGADEVTIASERYGTTRDSRLETTDTLTKPLLFPAIVFNGQ